MMQLVSRALCCVHAHDNLTIGVPKAGIRSVRLWRICAKDVQCLKPNKRICTIPRVEGKEANSVTVRQVVVAGGGAWARGQVWDRLDIRNNISGRLLIAI